MFFACPSLRARRENQSKIVSNARLDRVARRIVFKSCSFALRSVKMATRGVSGASLGALERLLGRSWALLGRSWGTLGRSWGALGALLGRSWGAPGPFWEALGTDSPDGPPDRAKIDPSRFDSRSDGPFRPTESTQDRSKSRFRPTLSTQVARKTLRKAILVDLGSIF